jgi:HK97 gp10 family phage protein
MSTRDEVIAGGRELDDLLRTLPVKMHRNINRAALRAGAAVYLAEVKPRIPEDSGQLRASARITTRAKGDEVSASVKVGNFVAWYAHLVEFQTRPHVIEAKPGHAMRFGSVVTHEVHHPGTRAQPFMRPAADAGFARAVQAVTAKIRQRLTKEGLNVPPALPSDPTS